MASPSFGIRLEQYTLRRPDEVLLVNVQVGDEPDQIAVFRGFSSSLMRPTAYDPDVPVLPETAAVQSIDRLRGPFDPSNPQVIQAGLSVEEMQSLFQEVGV
ncbi:MAG: hypothetical protein VKK04_14290 [Synechococcales bacterium]|nr:hypothetical protein [Synechococcales bacterium]